MVLNEHTFAISARWDGNRGSGTSGYRDYGREVHLSAPSLTALDASAAQAFRGDSAKWNPELFLIAALSECHLLSYLHAAVLSSVTVVEYEDHASGTMVLNDDGSGHFTSVMLRPVVTILRPEQRELALELHEQASSMCFIANSVNFPVLHEAHIRVAETVEKKETR